MQRLIVEQLKLPASVMEALDTQDEEDDYQGVGKGSRAEIPQVAEAINQHILKLVTNHRFLVIFHNGSSEEIDLGNFGFPLSGYLRNKVLWSFQGRFRLYPRVKVEMALGNTRTTTDVVLLAGSTAVDLDKLSDILRHEAEEVACKMINAGGIDWPAAATCYFLYMMKLYGMDNNINDYDISTHGCNYWKCDGMIQFHEQENIGTGDGVDKLWISADALYSEIQMDEDYYKHLSSPVERSLNKCMAYWSSPTYGFMLIPDPHGQIPEGMFQIFDKLYVLKLSACKFSFTSPPFLCCYNLRYLWLDHCQDKEESSTCEEVKLEDIRRFFQRIWVLDMRYSNKAFLSNRMTYYMTQLRELNVVGEEWSGLDLDLVQSQLHNIRTLRVKEASVPALFLSGMDKMELLDLSENFYRLNILSVECSSSLETVIINGSTNLRYISLERCPKLKNIFLSGSLDNLHLIGITGTAIETLDLSAVIAPELEILYLLDCEKLCAIIWPPDEDIRKTSLKRLHIDTTQKEGTTTLPVEHTVGRPLSKFDWHISASDARILKSLDSIKDYFGPNHSHVEISSPSHHPYADDGGSKDDEMKSSSGRHVQVKRKQLIENTAIYAYIGDSDASAIMCVCPPPPSVPSQGCYIYIEDKMRAKLQTASTTIPAFICDSAKILHMHDSLHITSVLATPLSSMTWNQLEWCRVERCLKLGCVFSPQLGEGREGRNNDIHDMFKNLRTVWASHLPNARCIWQWSGSSRTWFYGGTFENLAFLHIDYCPRLIHIIHFPLVENALDRLETLEIMCCSDLSVAFQFYDTLWKSGSETGGWIFLKLKQIILHELPKLQNICNIGKKVFMPELETIKIRGCWSLTTLPIVESKNVVECNCEKEWWDRLEWESVEHARKYKLTYPRHYKMTMLKGSVLR